MAKKVVAVGFIEADYPGIGLDHHTVYLSAEFQDGERYIFEYGPRTKTLDDAFKNIGGN